MLIAGCSAGDGSGAVKDTDGPVVGETSESAESATPIEDDDGSTSAAQSSTTAGEADASSDPSSPSDSSDPTDTSSPPKCLDGTVDEGEQCDDGNDVNGDGCNRDCQLSGQLVWQTSLGSGLGQIDQAYDIAPQPDGSALVTGYISADAEGSRDGWMGRYDSDGLLTWEVVLTGPGGANDEIRAVLTDGAGNVFASGYTSGPKGQRLDAWVGQYDLMGEPVWTQSYNGSDSLNDIFNTVALDADGNVILGGYSQSPTSGNDVFLRKLAADGSVLWSRVFPGPNGGTDLIWKLDVSPAGHIYAAGYQEGPDGEGRNSWLAKYDADGNEIWSRSFNGPESNNDYLVGIAVLGEDDVVVSGYEEGNAIPWQVVVRRYDALGMTVWTDRYAGGSGEGAHAFGVEADPEGAIVVTGGEILGKIRHVLVRKYDMAGAELWTSIVPGGAAGPDYGREVTIGSAGEVWLAGAVDTGADDRDIWVGRFTP